MRLGYADPPYPGCAHMYKDHPDCAGEVDHEALISTLDEYDGWVLHTSAPHAITIGNLIGADRIASSEVRIVPWVKSFAAYKKGVPLAYAWEPCFVKAARKPVVSKRLTMRDWVECPITMRRGLTGAKPEQLCWHLFEALGAHPDDDLDDMYPGTGAVTKAWVSWRGLFMLPDEEPQP